jgi:DNA end-binding protein Ku
MAKTKTVKVEVSKEDKIVTLSAALNTKPQVVVEAFSPAEKTFAVRVGWKGTLEFGGLTFPVGTYTAIKEGKVEFNTVHTSCGTRLKQGAMGFSVRRRQVRFSNQWCEHCDTNVEKDEQSREELEACEPANDKILEIVRFVKSNEIDPIYFGKTEFLGTEGENKKSKADSQRGYALLLEGMLGTSTVALAKRSTRGREQWLILRPFNTTTIVASDLLFGYEVRAFDKTNDLPAANVQEAELAEQLIEAMTEEFNENAQY